MGNRKVTRCRRSHYIPLQCQQKRMGQVFHCTFESEANQSSQQGRLLWLVLSIIYAPFLSYLKSSDLRPCDGNFYQISPDGDTTNPPSRRPVHLKFIDLKSIWLRQNCGFYLVLFCCLLIFSAFVLPVICYPGLT